MDPAFMDWLETVRIAYGAPMIITSGYRCPDSDTKAARHRTGKVADTGINGSEAVKLLAVALVLDAQGVGVNQKGPHNKRFLHLDMIRPGGKHPAPWIWSY